MLLPQFNLTPWIQTYNQSKSITISTQEDFGYPYFERSLFNACQQTIAAINNAAELFVFSNEENQQVVERRSKLKTWRASAKTSPGTIKQIYDRFKQIYVLPENIATKKSLDEWRRQYYALFQNTENWINITKAELPLAKFHALKANWNHQALFARHSHQAISKMAFEWLPHLIKHHKAALNDLKWHYFSMPKKIYVEYKNYLHSFLKKSQQLQQKLAGTMLSRLKIWHETGFKHADIMVQVADKLHIEHPPCRESLTTQQFSTFHRYIRQHGSLDARRSLRELNWVKPNPVFPLKTVENKKTILFVPATIKEDVPKRIRKPNWLYHGANLRYSLCEQHSMDYVRLQQLPDIAHLAIDISKPDVLAQYVQSIAENQQLAKQLLAETQQEKFTGLSFWHWRTKRFLKNYAESLQNYQHKTVEAQFQLAEKIVQQLMVNKDAIAAGLQASSSICHVLHQLMQSLKAQLGNLPQNSDGERLARLEKQTEQLLSINRVKDSIAQLAAGDTLTPDALEQAKTIITKIAPIQKVLLEHTFKPLTTKLVTQLSTELKHNPDAFSREQQYSKHFRSIEQLYALLQLLAPEQLGEMLPNRISRYFLYYLNTTVRCGIDPDAFTKKQLVFETFERVLNLFEHKNTLFVGAKTLAEHLQHLKELRTELSTLELCDLQVEAQSLNVLLGDDCLVMRVNKDCQTLDRQITNWLKTHPQLRCSDETIKTAFKLRDTFAELSDEPSDDEVMKKLKFTTTEQVLVGLTAAPEESAARTVIPQLMKLSGQTQRLRQMIQMSNLTYESKLERLHDFQKYIEKGFVLLRKNYHVPPDIGKNKHHSSLFFKTYIPEPDSLPIAVLASENNQDSHSPARNNQ